MSNDEQQLDQREMDIWLALIRMIMRLPEALEDQLRRDVELTHFEFAVLATLENAEDQTMRMSELARICNGSLSRLSHVARRLEGAGLLERFACPKDARATNAHLTDSGKTRLAKAAPGHLSMVRKLVFDQLSEKEADQLGALARRLLQGIDAD